MGGLSLLAPVEPTTVLGTQKGKVPPPESCLRWWLDVMEEWVWLDGLHDEG